MPELRWILLGVGLLFLAGLALWESRRQKRLPPQAEAPTQHRFREPALGLPELRSREPAAALPVLEIDDSMIGMRADGVRIEQDLVAIDEPSRGPLAEPPDEPSRPDVPPEPESGPEALAHFEFDSAPDERDERDEHAPAAALPPEAVQPEPIVEWPPEEERRLVSVRITPKPGDRLSGRAVRLALAAEGFVHGKYAIFHKSGPDAHVVVSAASLTKPGCFDLETMDSQRYGGLGLFSVLPGHLSSARMLDELFDCARNLGERLGGLVQDEQGAPLDAERIAALRSGAATGTVATLAVGESDPADAP